MKLLVFDGNNILNRSFYGVPILSTKSGQFTNAIHGFLSSFLKIKAEINPDAIVFAFDLPKKTFRNVLNSDYKSNRKQMPDELKSQFPILQELLQAMGYTILSYEGFEADDIIGTLAEFCEKNFLPNPNNNDNVTKAPLECVIATGDRDCLQLISDKVFVRLLRNRSFSGDKNSFLYDGKKFFDEYKILPKEFIDVKALQGDSSDNIKGVPGIGPKTAVSLIQKFKSIENIYDNLENLDIKNGLKLKLSNGKEYAFMSKTLATIKRDVPILIDFEKYFLKNIRPNVPKVLSVMHNLELFTMVEKFGFNEKIDENNSKISTKFLNDKENSSEIEKKILNSREVFILTDFSPNHSQSENHLFISFDNEFSVNIINQDSLNIEMFFEKLGLNSDITVVTHDSKRLRNFYYEINSKDKTKKISEATLKIDFDTAIAAHLLNSSAKDYSLSKLFLENFINKPEFETFEYDDKIKEITCQTFMLKKLKSLQTSQLTEINCLELLKNIEMPLSQILFEMEKLGVEINSIELAEHALVLRDRMTVLQSEIFNTIGSEFNLNSPKQLSEVLYKKLKLPHAKKTKIGGFSTSAKILERLKYSHPIVGKISDFRVISKFKSTFCDGILEKIDSNNRIHSNFKQTETSTRRISSSEPNLQNIPIRSKEGEIFRMFFKSHRGCTLVDADYSQIELRILAHISRDTNMIQAFINGDDIHVTTASQIFNVPVSRVTPEMRARAKTVNFGIIYGMGAFSLASQFGIFLKKAEDYINSYFEHYSGVEIYMEKIVNFAQKNGYVETIFHRRRYLPEINSKNHNKRAAAERMARNMPIQGTSADIIKIAMINIDKKLKIKGLKSRLVLQIHDELIVEAPDDEIEDVKEILNNEMRNVAELLVPLEVNIGSGKTWHDCKQ